jgi:molybdenum cofactor cytidylyltransferase
MNSASHLCGLILAAGESSRMGADKALLPWPPRASAPATPPGQTLLSAAILALQPLTRAVIVVAGKNAEAIGPAVDEHGAFLVRNPAPERGQFSSLQVGLRELLARGCDAAIVAPVDCPPLSATSLDILRVSFERALTRGLWAVAPEHNGKHGHPLLVNRSFIDAFLAAPVTGTAREVLHSHPQRIEYVPVPEALEKAGLNTPEDYAAVAEKTPAK